jgi:transposase-like protein
MSVNLTDPIFHDNNAARTHLEAVRWPEGPVCPHCGNTDQERIRALKGKSHRPGLYQCNECREHFTVTVGSVMERSHIPLAKWVLGFHLMAASKKGISAHQLMRTLGLGSYRTAWFMAHRIREAMTEKNPGPLGGEGKTVEADETYIGNSRRNKSRNKATFVSGKGWTKTKNASGADKFKVVALVERGGRSIAKPVDHITANAVRDILVRNVDRKSDLRTDEANVYKMVGREFASHKKVNHGEGEYGRGEIHTNTIEGYFSIFKRGMKGVYQHCGEAHLARYLAEFDFRYSNRSALGVEDAERANKAMAGAEGKRLTYRQPRQVSHA